MKRFLLLFSLFSVLAFSVFAQIPAGYYDTALGKKQAELKTALHLKIRVADVPSYGSGAGSTWAAFAKTDVRPEDGTVWDMYSNNHIAFNGVSAASGMNIEHSFAKSWWGDGRQASKDVMHLAPSNSTANSAKGSWPMAVVNGTTSFTNDVIKVGKSGSRPGGEITAWEPADEYKGDFSRAYMYMVTAYEDYSTLWTGNSVNQLDNNTYPVFEQWTVDMLLKWSEQDPVSQKEITRNNEVYKIQGNRNPYIDYQLMGEYVWGKLITVPFTTDGNVDYPYLSTPSSGTNIDFGKVSYQQTGTSTLLIKALNLTGNLSVTVGGTDAANFTPRTTTITKAQAEAGFDLIINFAAQTIGVQTASLAISGGGITGTSVNLTATGTDEFMALPANQVTASSFVANWTASAEATGYTLNIYSLLSDGVAQSVTLLEEDFLSGLPAGWASEGYANKADMPGSIRMASGSQIGKIIFPVLDLSGMETTLTVQARQYSNDAGAELTATLNNQTLAVWPTGIANQDFTVSIPQGTASSTIALSAAAGKRLFVDYVKVATKGTILTPVPFTGYPKSTGNVLSYNIEGLESNSTYYYSVLPQGNSTVLSGQIEVRTGAPSGIEQTTGKSTNWSASPEGILLQNLPAGCHLSLLDMMGKQLQTIQPASSEILLRLPQKGVFLLRVQRNEGMETIKILY